MNNPATLIPDLPPLKPLTKADESALDLTFSLVPDIGDQVNLVEAGTCPARRETLLAVARRNTANFRVNEWVIRRVA